MTTVAEAKQAVILEEASKKSRVRSKQANHFYGVQVQGAGNVSLEHIRFCYPGRNQPILDH
jgi:hypothetical protein